jgi:hypothetical protein
MNPMLDLSTLSKCHFTWFCIIIIRKGKNNLQSFSSWHNFDIYIQFAATMEQIQTLNRFHYINPMPNFFTKNQTVFYFFVLVYQ